VTPFAASRTQRAACLIWCSHRSESATKWISESSDSTESTCTILTCLSGELQDFIVIDDETLLTSLSDDALRNTTRRQSHFTGYYTARRRRPRPPISRRSPLICLLRAHIGLGEMTCCNVLPLHCISNAKDSRPFAVLIGPC
jgi:hypothetical protein